LLEYIFESISTSRHGNIFEVTIDGAGNLCSNFIGYNNVMSNTNQGVGWWIQCPNYYIFNNVWSNSGHYPPDGNGMLLSPPGSSGSSVVHASIYNNTFQANAGGAGPSNSATPAWASGSVETLENNHVMDFTSISTAFPCTGSGNTCTLTNNGGHTFQTTSAANAQGFTVTNNYAPISSLVATVNAGVNATSFCNSVPNTAASLACKSSIAGVAEVNQWGGKGATYPAVTPITRPAAGAWDAGAYQFTPGAVPPTVPPIAHRPFIMSELQWPAE
jgi:hypothetical protein